MPDLLLSRTAHVFAASVRRPLVILSSVGLIGGTVLVALLPINRGVPVQLSGMFIFWFAYATSGLSIHVKDLFIRPAARLVPGFAAPHLLAAGLVSLATCAGVPLVIGLGAHLPPRDALALLAVVTVVHTVMAWCVYSPYGEWGGLWLACLVSSIFPPPYNLVYWLYAAMTPPLSVAFVAACVIALAELGRRLTSLNEEERAYRQAFQFRALTPAVESERVAVAIANRSPLVQLMLPRRDRSLDAAIARPGAWWPVRRWRLPLIGHVAETIALLYWAPVTIMTLYLHDRGGILSSAAALGPMFIALLPLMRWRTLRPLMGVMMLRPVSRRRFLAQVAGAAALEAGMTALCFCLGGAAAFWITGSKWTGVLPVVDLIPVAGATMLLTLACGFWMIRVKSTFLFHLGVMGAVYAVMLPVFLSSMAPRFASLSGLPVVGLIAAIAACLAVLVASDAWRRWLVAELD
ncbi:MAG: hypothetical protein NTW19_21235 [Planctomycetota bacterium]|nr:hypothetical protein [Planctomycetota bacterium]